MPHIVVEYSANLRPRVDLPAAPRAALAPVSVASPEAMAATPEGAR